MGCWEGVGAQKGWGYWPYAGGGSQHAEQLSRPSCGARGHRPIFAARGGPSARKSCNLQSGVSPQSKFYDSNVCHIIAPRVLEKRPVHALSALV